MEKRKPSKSRLITKLMISSAGATASGLITLTSFGASLATPFIIEDPLKAEIVMGAGLLSWSSSLIYTGYLAKKSFEVYRELRRYQG